MIEDNNPAETVPQAHDVGAGEGDANVSTPEANLSLKEINELTGRNYSDVDTARKAIKETYSHVGSKTSDTPVAQPTPQTQPAAQVSTEDPTLRDLKFFFDNPEYNTPEAKELLRDFGGDPNEVVKKPSFKKALEAFQSGNSDNSQNILPSNSRQGGSSEEYDKDFAEAQRTGKWTDFLIKHKGLEAPK